ncbi:hypothetical protein SEPCBS57363_004381 [Sporothrix epigloea]|uniref:Indoleamine 2,3-dioxygenase n=1 Tax=Sporothrix epigloea TaxID=1892477 RepID=A0ABP0DVR9_9PEZI
MNASFREQFGLSDNGFLPSDLPLARLPDPSYAPWEAILTNLPSSLRNNTLRSQIQRLPVLSVDGLTTEPEWRRAYLILTFLTHAYIWGDEPVAEVLPPCITVPLLAVSDHLELPPVATYAALNLWNFAVTGGDEETSTNFPFDDLNHLKALHTFTGTESESWFFVVSVAMECRAAAILPVLLNAVEAATRNDVPSVTAALRRFVACIHDLSVLLGRMHERCDPSVFFNQIRPFLAGSKNMAAHGLPRGVFYDLGDGLGEWRQLRGGSNGQSSLLQFFDIVLGIEHTSDGQHSQSGSVESRSTARPAEKAEIGFHDEVRGYMPGPHRRFLEYVAALPSLRAFVLAARGKAASALASDEQDILVTAFSEATEALAALRNKHLGIVTRYIIIPSRQKQAAQAFNGVKNLHDVRDTPAPKLRGLASRAACKDEAEVLKGTGGTELLPFLKQTRDETLQAGVFASCVDVKRLQGGVIAPESGAAS